MALHLRPFGIRKFEEPDGGGTGLMSMKASTDSRVSATSCGTMKPRPLLLNSGIKPRDVAISCPKVSTSCVAGLPPWNAFSLSMCRSNAFSGLR